MQEITNKTIDKLKYDLVRDRLISYENLSKAEEISQKTSINLAQVIIQQNFLSEESLLSFIESKLHIPYVNLDDYTLDKTCLCLISQEDAQKYKIIPLFKIEDVLTVAMADPLDLFVLNTLINSVNYIIEPIICSERSIIQAIENYYSQNVICDVDKKEDFNWQNELRNELSDEKQAERIINAVFYQAALESCSEISFTPIPEGLNVKFKKNKKILEKGIIPVLLVPLFKARLKTLSNINPDLSELPQLGKTKFIFNNIPIIACVSTFPTINDERITIKIFMPPKKIENVITDKDKLDKLLEDLNNSGIILATGNNTDENISAVYSLLSSINKDKNIFTIESVAKFDLSQNIEINHCELNEKTGFDLDKIMRFIEFQSPDVVYFEDLPTQAGLDFALSLAQSGKLVLTQFTVKDLESLKQKLANNEIFKAQILNIIYINEKIEVLNQLP